MHHEICFIFTKHHLILYEHSIVTYICTRCFHALYDFYLNMLLQEEAPMLVQYGSMDTPSGFPMTLTYFRQSLPVTQIQGMSL